MASEYTTLVKVLHVDHTVEQAHAWIPTLAMQERVESSYPKRVRMFNNASHEGAWLTMQKEMGDFIGGLSENCAGGTTKTSAERKLTT
jgi:hypothetical protein